MKRADIPIAAIFSIILTLIAIYLMFVVFGGKAQFTNDLYCKHVSQITIGVWQPRPEECAQTNLAFSSVPREEGNITKFLDGSESKNAYISHAKPYDTFSLIIPRGVMISTARMHISTGKEANVISTFNDSLDREPVFLIPNTQSRSASKCRRALR